jgi:hypothetical protein
MANEAELSQLLWRRMRAQADLFAALTAHPTLVGEGRQEAFAEVLRQLMPRRLEVLSGTIALLDGDQQAMRSTQQIDIIVADTMDFPTLVRSGNVAVVLPQSVHAVIEVKSNLQRGPSFVAAIAHIARTRQLFDLSGPAFTGVFSFGAPANPETLRDWLGDVVALRQLLLTGQAEQSIVRLRDAMLESPDSSMRIADETELLAVLASDNLPDVIAADRGAIARKIDTGGLQSYRFTQAERHVPSVAILIGELVDQLGTGANVSIGRGLAALQAYLALDLNEAPGVENLALPEFVPPSLMAR